MSSPNGSGASGSQGARVSQTPPPRRSRSHSRTRSRSPHDSRAGSAESRRSSRSRESRRSPSQGHGYGHHGAAYPRYSQPYGFPPQPMPGYAPPPYGAYGTPGWYYPPALPPPPDAGPLDRRGGMHAPYGAWPYGPPGPPLPPPSPERDFDVEETKELFEE